MEFPESAEILLVEDNPDDEELTRIAFKETGIRNSIFVAHDGVEALEYFFGADAAWAGRNPLPRVILLDLKLPRISGLEVLKRLRSDPRTCCLPVIVLTTSSQEEDIVESYRSGANSFLRKPVEFRKYIDMIRHLGAYWLQMNQVPLA